MKKYADFDFLGNRYTFWVAAVVLALTIVFGLAQTIEGGIQAYYTVHPVTQ